MMPTRMAERPDTTDSIIIVTLVTFTMTSCWCCSSWIRKNIPEPKRNWIHPFAARWLTPPTPPGLPSSGGGTGTEEEEEEEEEDGVRVGFEGETGRGEVWRAVEEDEVEGEPGEGDEGEEEVVEDMDMEGGGAPAPAPAAPGAEEEEEKEEEGRGAIDER